VPEHSDAAKVRRGLPLRAVAFDLDGTLADTLGLNIAAFQHAFARTTGRSFSAEEICDLCGASQEGVVARWRATAGGSA